MIEAEVHLSLRQFIREQGEPLWQHHLTMARLVARGFRLGRSALMQTGSLKEEYILSYLTPALMWKKAVIIVAPEEVQKRLLQVDIPRLKEWLDTDKKIIQGEKFPDNFQGLFLTSTTNWLEDRLDQGNRFPTGIPTIIDRVDNLEDLTRQQLTREITSQDWEELVASFPAEAEAIRNIRIKLTKSIFEHPQNPYNCYLLTTPEQELLVQLQSLVEEKLRQTPLLDSGISRFWQTWQNENQLLWASLRRETGRITIHSAPVEVATALSPIWEQQPVVLIGGFLDWETSAPIYRQQVGLGDLTCLKFAANHRDKQISLYCPDNIPMPNTPQFQSTLIQQMLTLISLRSSTEQPIVLLVGDLPLKGQVGARMAAEFGSRVKVEQTNLEANSILVSGWEFWRTHGDHLPTPQLLVIATLPIPSLENPLVATRVAYYKQARKDWFRVYLLPTALRELQRAIAYAKPNVLAPIRPSQSMVALLDNRVNHRSYGRKILSALEPFARTNYLDPDWLEWDTKNDS